MTVTFWLDDAPVHRLVDQMEDPPGVAIDDYIWIRTESAFFNVVERWAAPASHEWPGWHIVLQRAPRSTPPWERKSPR